VSVIGAGEKNWVRNCRHGHGVAVSAPPQLVEQLPREAGSFRNGASKDFGDPLDRRMAHKLGLVRSAVLSRRAVRGLSRADRGRMKAGREPREQCAVRPHLLLEPDVTLDLWGRLTGIARIM
jgi:hypothetical protein